MSDTQSLETRIMELESRLTFQQETIDGLNDVVSKQWKQIDILKRKLDDMDGQIYALENGQVPGGEPPPPHY